MPGLYVHIPFCGSRCIYCDFYSTTAAARQPGYVAALCREYALRRNEILDLGCCWDTIYIGGGTPSTLEPGLLGRLFDTLAPDIGRCTGEITMECNPDDITPGYAAALAKLPVNRISMGAQTFDDRRLQFLRRRHSSHQIAGAVANLRRAGFTNISVDLMYGFPGESVGDLRIDIDRLLALGVPHISAYCLMYEEGTPLHRMLEQGRVGEVPEDVELAMYSEIVSSLTAAGYEHYEISNFARRDFRSRHNSSYWTLAPYLGIGAAAHSFDGRSVRSYNPPHLIKYIEAMESSVLPVVREHLTNEERYNDYVMLRLRTREGINLNELEKAFGSSLRRHTELTARQFIDGGQLAYDADSQSLHLTSEGVFVSNMVMSEFMEV